MNDLRKMFNDFAFRIPDYQRGYAWGQEQLQDLWDDISEMTIENGRYRPHYTGVIHIDKFSSRIPDEDAWCMAAEYRDVVDGQQRLTTLYILLLVLIDAAQDSGYCGLQKDLLQNNFLYFCSGGQKVYKLDYDKHDPNREFLVKVIYEGCEIAPNMEQSLYTKNLLNAKKFFQKKVAETTDKQDLFSRVAFSLLFDVQNIDAQFDVRAVFETMNNRGKPLTLLEKLKNRLMYLCLGAKVPIAMTEVERNAFICRRKRVSERIKTVWGKLYHMLGKNIGSPMSENEFVIAHLSLYRKPIGNDAVFSSEAAEKKLFRMFCIKPERYTRSDLSDFDGKTGSEHEPACTLDKIENYVADIESFYPYWELANEDDDLIVNKIKILNGSRVIRILLAAIYKETYTDEALRTESFKLLEKILFRNTVPNVGFRWEGALANDAREIYRRKENIDCIESASLRDKIDEILHEWRAKPADEKQIANGFSYLYTYVYQNKGFHRWTGLKYLLFEYEECLYHTERFRRDSLAMKFECYGGTTIEHIMPRNFCRCWNSEAEEYLCHVPESEIETAKKVMINTLGNLTLLLHEKNSHLQDGPWCDKRKEYRHGCFSEQEIADVEHWDKYAVLARGKTILKLLSDKLEIPEFSSEAQCRILYYSPELYKSIFYGNQKRCDKS